MSEERTEDIGVAPYANPSPYANEEEQMNADTEEKWIDYSTAKETTTLQDMGPPQTALDDFLPPKESEKNCNPTLRVSMHLHFLTSLRRN